jgi:hypothetical protein
MESHPLSLYSDSSSISDRIYYLKHYETYDSAYPVNPKMERILCDSSANLYLNDIIDAIIHTRTINGGRGLRDLTYSYLWTLHKYRPLHSVFLIHRMMDFENGKQIGSWRDVRAYADFISIYSQKGRDDPIISPVLGLYNHQLFKDRSITDRCITDRPTSVLETTDLESTHPSYAAKWVPRERKCKWMFEKLLDMWIHVDPESKKIMASAISPESLILARNKCRMIYRKLVSKINTHLDTVEIKECAGRWAEIVPENVPVNHLNSNGAALERHTCNGAFSGRNYMCGIPSWKLVKKMLQLQKANNQVEIEKMNYQWSKRSTREYDYYIAMVDVSQPMYTGGAQSLYNAIGIGCEIASKSIFGQRVLAFSPKPYWVDLDGCTFGEMVRRIISAIWTPETYLDGAFSTVLEAALFADMTPEEVLGLKLVLLTNRMDEESLPAHIVEEWHNAGVQKFGRPFLLDRRNFEKITV